MNSEMYDTTELTLEEQAKAALGKVTVGFKTTGKRFLAILIAIEDRYYVFETKKKEVIRNPKECIASLTPVVG